MRRPRQDPLALFALALGLASACGKSDDSKEQSTQQVRESGPRIDARGPAPPWDAATFAKMAETQVPGLELRENPVPTEDEETAWVSYQGKRNAQGMLPSVKVMLIRCPERCLDLAVDELASNEQLKAQMLLSRAHAENPDLVWEVEEVDVGGMKGAGIYARSFLDGDGRAVSRHLYRFYYHERRQLIMVQVTSSGPAATTAQQLERQMPKAEMTSLASKVFEQFARYY